MSADGDEYDGVIVGSGINALVAASLLAKAGWRIALCERNATLGGAIATSTSHVPGFTIELLSSWHPLFVGGPAYAALAPDLAARGVVFTNTAQPTGVACADGTAVLSTDPEAAAAQFAALGDLEAWQATMADFGSKANLAFGLLGTDFWRRSALRFGWGAYRQLGRQGLIASGKVGGGVGLSLLQPLHQLRFRRAIHRQRSQTMQTQHSRSCTADGVNDRLQAPPVALWFQDRLDDAP